MTSDSPEAAPAAFGKNKLRAKRSTSPDSPRVGEDHLLGEREVAAKLSLSPATLRNWRVQGRGPRWVRLSARAIRYRDADIEEWLRARVRRSTSETERDHD